MSTDTDTASVEALADRVECMGYPNADLQDAASDMLRYLAAERDALMAALESIRGAAQAASREVPPPDDPPIPDPREETRRALIEWATAYGRRVAAQAAQAPRWWKCPTHGPARPDAWGCPECVREMRKELAQAPREVPRLKPEQIAKAMAPLYSDPRAAAMGLPDDIRTARIVEGLVRELCGVAP